MDRFRSLRWRLAVTFFVLALVLLAATGYYLLRWTARHYTTSVTDDLRHESLAVAEAFGAAPENPLRTIDAMGRALGHRITLIKPDGTVVADSERDAASLPNHSDRPEFRQALATGFGKSTRYSATLRTQMLYVATPYGPRSARRGVVRLAEPLSGLDQVRRTIQRTFIVAGLVAIFIAALLSLRLALGVSEPLERIAAAARKLEAGQLDARVSGSDKGPAELADLRTAFNAMADRVQANVAEVERQNSRMHAVFNRTDNGLILEDADGRIAMINAPACRMLDTDCGNAAGKTLLESTLSHDLAGLVQRVRQNSEPSTLDIFLHTSERRAVRAFVAPISGADGRDDVLIVLHDLAASQRLDEIRRDFLANASHELRTPLATIKAMAETILLRHESSPSAVQEYAEGIVHEADRMTALAEDLLSLTSIESQSREMNVEQVRLRELVDEVFEHLRLAAAGKSISLSVDVADSEIVCVDRASLSQALANLVDNAIKYTPEGGAVAVKAGRSPGGLKIDVIDNGIGIPSGDRQRIFERFYRVDKDRSRQSGGTGLGLAIVKHLCEQMGASVSVTSTHGEGSTFSMVLPQPAH